MAASVPTRVVVSSGRVIVRLVLVPGAAIVNSAVPLTFGASFIFDIISSYTIVQTVPLGIVTIVPALIVTGPAVIAFLLAVIEYVVVTV